MYVCAYDDDLHLKHTPNWIFHGLSFKHIYMHSSKQLMLSTAVITANTTCPPPPLTLSTFFTNVLPICPPTSVTYALCLSHMQTPMVRWLNPCGLSTLHINSHRKMQTCKILRSVHKWKFASDSNSCLFWTYLVFNWLKPSPALPLLDHMSFYNIFSAFSLHSHCLYRWSYIPSSTAHLPSLLQCLTASGTHSCVWIIVSL